MPPALPLHGRRCHTRRVCRVCRACRRGGGCRGWGGEPPTRRSAASLFDSLLMESGNILSQYYFAIGSLARWTKQSLPISVRFHCQFLPVASFFEFWPGKSWSHSRGAAEGAKGNLGASPALHAQHAGCRDNLEHDKGT